MKVRAVFPDGGFGFDGLGRRWDGDEFSIDGDKFDPSWMALVEESEVAEADEEPGSVDTRKVVRKGGRKAAKAGA